MPITITPDRHSEPLFIPSRFESELALLFPAAPPPTLATSSPWNSVDPAIQVSVSWGLLPPVPPVTLILFPSLHALILRWQMPFPAAPPPRPSNVYLEPVIQVSVSWGLLPPVPPVPGRPPSLPLWGSMCPCIHLEPNQEEVCCEAPWKNLKPSRGTDCISPWPPLMQMRRSHRIRAGFPAREYRNWGHEVQFIELCLPTINSSVLRDGDTFF